MKIKRIIPLILLFLACYSNNFGQAAGNYLYNQSSERDYKSTGEIFGGFSDGNIAQTLSYYPVTTTGDTVITLNVKVMMNVHADTYVAIFGVSQAAETVDSCHQMIKRRVSGFLKNIKQLGVKDADIYIDFISQVPVFEFEEEKKLFSKTYNEVPKGFELKKNVHISYKEEKIVDDLLVLAAQNEIYDIVKVDYVINDMETVYDTLRKVSIDLMNKKVKDFKRLGINFTPMYQTVNEQISGTYPIERYASYAAFNPASISNVKKGSGRKVAYRWAKKPKTLYYNKLPYNNYDVVINPTVVEPVVQFSYTLNMKYVLKKL